MSQKSSGQHVGGRLAEFICNKEKVIQIFLKFELILKHFNLQDWFPLPPVLVAPVVEPPHSDAFLLESPEDAYNRGHVAKKPWITGTTSHEGMTAVLGSCYSI